MDAINHRNENISYYQEYDRNRAKLLHRKEINKKYNQSQRGKNTHKKGIIEWRKRNPEKMKAYSSVGNALRRGKIKRKSCEVCNKRKNVQAHHEDYSKPLNIKWLCVKCHNFAHKMEKLKIN
jgi:hypothetical protein